MRYYTFKYLKYGVPGELTIQAPNPGKAMSDFFEQVQDAFILTMQEKHYL